MSTHISQSNRENNTNHSSYVSKKKTLSNNTQPSGVKSGDSVVKSEDHTYTFVGIAG